MKKNTKPLSVADTAFGMALKSGRSGVLIPAAELSVESVHDAIKSLGYDDDIKSIPTWISADEEDQETTVKPTLVRVERDSPRHGQITLKTLNPTKTATVEDTISPQSWDQAFKKLGVTPDDYVEHMAWLRKNGIQHANAHLIHYSEPEELTVPTENAFGYLPTKAPQQLYPSLHIDTDLTIDDLFEFKIDTDAPIFTIDAETRKSILELFEFNPEKKPKKSS